MKKSLPISNFNHPSARKKPIAWCMGASGGTTGPMSVAANRMAAESAFYLSNPDDLVIVPFKPEIKFQELLTISKKTKPINYVVADLHKGLDLLSSKKLEILLKNRPTLISPEHEWLKDILREAGVQIIPNNNPLVLAMTKCRGKLMQEMRRENISLPDLSICNTKEQLKKAVSCILERKTSVVVKTSQISGCPGTVIVRSKRELNDLLNSLKKINNSVTVEPLESIYTTINFQFLALDKEVVSLGDSIQITGEDSKSRKLQHCGNLQPTHYFVNRTSYEVAATQAELCTKAMARLGYAGMVGVDIILTRDGRVLVVDINARLNASTFLYGGLSESIRFANAKLFLFGRVLLPDGLARLKRAMIKIQQTTGCEFTHCFSPHAITNTGEIGINLLGIGKNPMTVLKAIASLQHQGFPWLTFPIDWKTVIDDFRKGFILENKP